MSRCRALLSACSAGQGGGLDARISLVETAPACLRVPHVQVHALHVAAEAKHDVAREDEYLAGVVLTCRWLAGRPVWSPITRRAEMPRSPALYRETPVTPEAIDVEHAASLGPQAPRDVQFMRGVAATLAWAWVGSGPPPLELSG